MLQIDKSKVVGEKNKNLVLETAGKIYIKQGSRYYELNYKSKPVTEAEAVSLAKQQINKIEPLDTSEFATKNEVRTLELNSVSKKEFEDSKAVQSALNDVFANNGEFTDSITPATVQTMQIIVGSEQLQFDWITDYNNIEKVSGPITINDDTREVTFKPGWIKHYTLGRPTSNDSVKPGDSSGYFKWYILNKDYKNEEYTEKLEPGTYYYYLTIPVVVDPETQTTLDTNSNETEVVNSNSPFTYEKATLQVDYETEDENLYPGSITENLENKGAAAKTGVGFINWSTSKLETYTANTQTNYRFYNLLYAVVTVTEYSITKSEMNGFTEITPGQIRAYLFASADGSSYLDLSSNSFKLGETLNFSNGTLEVGTSVLGGLLAAKDSAGNITAGINGVEQTVITNSDGSTITVNTKSNDHGKVLLFASPTISTSDTKTTIDATESKTIVYEDGLLQTTYINATGGSLANFYIENGALRAGTPKSGEMYLGSNLLRFIKEECGVCIYLGNNVLPAIVEGMGAMRTEINYDEPDADAYSLLNSEEWQNNIGIASYASGKYRNNFAFYSGRGQFAGLRPKLRRARGSIELTKIDHTIIMWPDVTSGYVIVTFPKSPEIGQYYEIVSVHSTVSIHFLSPDYSITGIWGTTSDSTWTPNTEAEFNARAIFHCYFFGEGWLIVQSALN